MISSSLRELFDSPPRDFSPTPLWWWSGAPVTAERIRWQMERFAAGGVYNLVVINLAPAGPLEEAATDDPPWFSEAWWDRFSDACDVAAELGMRMWFYDQIGFSGANLQGSITHEHPEAAGAALRSHALTVTGGRVAAPAGQRVLAASTLAGEPVAVGADGAVGAVAAPDGTCLQVFTTVPTAFDYLDASAVALLVDRVHGEFDRRLGHLLGGVIAGSFQDELPATNSWTHSLPARFRAEHGYDLLAELPALFAPLPGSARDDSRDGRARAAKVRSDYSAVRTAMTEEALFKPLGAWHDARGMLLGADQTNPARQGVPTQSTQLYSDYFRTHRWFSAAGSDHEGDAKVHSSMAHLYGHPRVWMESFHSSGWGGTLEDTWDWLLPMLRSGANLYNPHASYFGTAAGWFEWAPPSTDWRQPYWAHYPQFAAAVARTTSLLTWGTYDADVALLHPTATAQADLTLDAPVHHFGGRDVGDAAPHADRASRDYTALSGINNWFESEPGLLDAAGIAFDVIDDASLQASVVDGGRIAVREQRYRTVVLPSSRVLEEGTARRLLELLDAGGRVVVVGAAPELAAGTAGDDAVAAAVARHPRAVRVATPPEAVDALAVDERGDGGSWASSDVPLLVRRADGHAVVLVSGAYPNASGYPLRTGSARWDDYDFDSSRYAQARTVHLRSSVAEAEVWNPATGQRAAVAVQDDGQGGAVVDVPLAGAPLVLLVVREGEPGPRVPPDAAALVRSRVVLDGGWTGELVPTMDNTWGDMALPAGTSVADLQVWTMEWAEGGAAEPGVPEAGPPDVPPTQWSPTRATIGQRVRTLGPLPQEEAPAVLGPDDVAAVLAGDLPLADDAWQVRTFSASRGTEKDAGRLGMKGRVPEEFVRVPSAGPGEVVVLRVLVRSARPGAADLVVDAGAAKRVLWNGVELPAADGARASAPVVAGARPGGVDVLEVHLGADENAPARHGSDPVLGVSFHLVAPGGEGERPRFMRVGDGVVPDGRVEARRAFSVAAPVESARLVVGAATGVSVLLDGAPVARQEKVEYYEETWGANPMYFEHDLSAVLGQGAHELRLVVDSADPRDVVYADLVVTHPGASSTTTVVSGAGWSVRSGRTTGTSVEHRGQWGELAASHAAPRTHPLVGARWIGGDPVVGVAADAVSCGDDLAPRPQWYRLQLPSGAAGVRLPVAGQVEAWVDGLSAPVSGGVLHLEQPLQAPGELLVRSAPVAFDRAGALWSGPAVVTTVPAPVELAPWPEIGLRSWSGGLRYRRRVTVPPGARDAVLELGRVRGSAAVSVDGKPVGTVFCAPFAVPLPDVQGEVEVAVEVLGTLGPFFDAATPTTWVWPSQLVTGLVGPVVLSFTPTRAAPDGA